MTPQVLVWISVLMLVVGITALMLEIFIVPGFGVAGVGGIILIAWAILLLAVDFTQATAALVLALLATLVVFILGIRLFKKLNFFRKMTLETKQYSEAGYIAPQAELVMHIGKIGTALTPLRPAGAAEVFGQRLDVVTRGEFIPAGTAVEVVMVEGARVVVQAVEKPRQN
ncbi:MAG: NfeD family protein [Desulfocucumaceae bacterium]